MPEQTTIKHVSNVQSSLFIITAVLDLYRILINEQAYLETNFRMLWTSKSAVISDTSPLSTDYFGNSIIEGLRLLSDKTRCSAHSVFFGTGKACLCQA